MLNLWKKMERIKGGPVWRVKDWESEMFKIHPPKKTRASSFEFSSLPTMMVVVLAPGKIIENGAFVFD